MTHDIADLAGRFEEAKRIASAMVAAIPTDVSPAAEHTAIEAAYAPVADLAERIVAHPATDDGEEKVRAAARAWLSGRD